MNDTVIRLLLVEDEADHAELVRRAFMPADNAIDVMVAKTLAEARRHLAAR